MTRSMQTGARTKDLAPRGWAAINSTPFPFRIKEVLILTGETSWFFGTLVHHLRSPLAFRIKLLFLALTSLSIYWPFM